MTIDLGQNQIVLISSFNLNFCHSQIHTFFVLPDNLVYLH